MKKIAQTADEVAVAKQEGGVMKVTDKETFLILPDLVTQDSIVLLRPSGAMLTVKRNSQLGIVLCKQYEAVLKTSKKIPCTVEAIEAKVHYAFVNGRRTIDAIHPA